MDESKKEVKVWGTQWIKVTVDTLRVMEAELEKYLSTGDRLITQGNDYLIVYADFCGDDSGKEKISFELFDYLTKLRAAINALLKLRVK